LYRNAPPVDGAAGAATVDQERRFIAGIDRLIC
jgi:hypothetical protein